MNIRTASLLTALLFLAAPLALVPSVSAQAPDCTPPSNRDPDPVWQTLCDFVTSPSPDGLGGTLVAIDHDLDGREDAAIVNLPNPQGENIPVYVQVDVFYSPASANSNTDYAGIAAALANDEPIDLPIDAMVLNPASGALVALVPGSGHGTANLRLTNHYGVPRAQIGNVEGYLGVYDVNAAHPDGYGSCFVCVQTSTNRIAARAGPATFVENNGAANKVGLLQANALGLSVGLVSVSLTSYPGFSLDLDTISPDTSTEIENSILERRVGPSYVDATPTSLLVSQRIFDEETSGDFDLDYPDGEPLHARFFHVKYQGDRGQPTDGIGPYSKYSNIDDDPNTDLQEFTCPGQPTNPVNPRAYCADWDGDGLTNDPPNDANPASPDVFMTLAWATGDANSDGVQDAPRETPFLAPLSFTCQGSTSDVIIQVSTDSGATWQNHEGFPDAENEDTLDADCDNLLGHDKPLRTNNAAATVEWQVRVLALNARSTPFTSNVLRVSVLPNNAPIGVASLHCTDSVVLACTSPTHRENPVEYAWRWTPDSGGSPGGVGVDDAGQSIVGISVRDCVDRNGNTNGLGAAPAMTLLGSGVWQAVVDYDVHASALHCDTVITVADSGGSSTAYNIAHDRQPMAPFTNVDGVALDSAEGGSLVTTFLYVEDSDTNGALVPWFFGDHSAKVFYYVDTGAGAPSGDGQFTPVTMFVNECAGPPYSETQNALLLEAQSCAFFQMSQIGFGANGAIVSSSEWQGEFTAPAGSTVYYFFEGTDMDGGLARVFNGTGYFKAGIPAAGPVPPGPTDPADYFIGDCNLIADLILRATTGNPAPGCDELDQDDYTSLLDGVTPGDDVDYRNTDGDGEFDESNDQVDFVEMYIASYDERENGRTSVRWYRTNGVTPVDREELRLTPADNPDTDVTELLLLVIDGQGVNPNVPLIGRPVPSGNVIRDTGYYYYCAYADGSSIRVGEGRTEAEACAANELPPLDESAIEDFVATLCDAGADPACDPAAFISGLPAEIVDSLCGAGVPLPDCGGDPIDPTALVCAQAPVPPICADPCVEDPEAEGCPEPDPCDGADPPESCPPPECDPTETPECAGDSLEGLPDMILDQLCDAGAPLPQCGGGDPDPVGTVCSEAPGAPVCGGGGPTDFPPCSTPRPDGSPRICRNDADNQLVTGNTNEFTGNEGGLILQVGNLNVKL